MTIGKIASRKPLAMTTRRNSLFTAYCLLLTAFLAHSLFYIFALGGDAVDDAYISFRYAQNAILGHGLIFNPGERVEGFTNFLWTVLMVPLEGAGVDVGRASIVLGVLFGLATIWLVVRFAKAGGLGSGVGIFAGLLLAVDGSFALWSVSGLETAMFGFLIFSGALLYVREQSNSSFPMSGILFALAAMTRPEGLFVFAITVAHQAAWRLLKERRLVTVADIERVAGFVVLFVPYWLGRWAYYHSFLPNSFYAKVAASGPEAQLERGWRYLSQFVNLHGGWLILVPAVIAVAAALRSKLGRSSSALTVNSEQSERNTQHAPLPEGTAHRSLFTGFWATYFAFLLIPYAAYIVYVGGDWSVGRFFLPLLPFFYLLFAAGAADIWGWLTRLWAKRVVPSALPTAVCLLLAAVLLVFSSWNGEYRIFIRGFDAGTATRARETMGKWLRANAAPGTLIAVDAAGQVPYFSGLPAVDMFGINDLHIGRMPVATLGQGTPGHEKFDLGYVVTRAPTYVVIYGTLFDSVPQYERAPVTWTSDPALTQFLTLYVRRN